MAQVVTARSIVDGSIVDGSIDAIGTSKFATSPVNRFCKTIRSVSSTCSSTGCHILCRQFLLVTHATPPSLSIEYNKFPLARPGTTIFQTAVPALHNYPALLRCFSSKTRKGAPQYSFRPALAWLLSCTQIHSSLLNTRFSMAASHIWLLP